MWKTFRRAIREGTEFGVCAGLILMFAELVTALVQRQPAFYPLRQVAGALVGQATLAEISTQAILLGGVVVHLLLSAVFGVVYGVANAWLSDRTQTRWGRQVALGVLYGAGVWALQFQLVARFLYPGFIDDRQFQFVQLTLHVFFFGLPLGLFYAVAERRLRPLRRALRGAD